MSGDDDPAGLRPLHQRGSFLLSQTGHFCATRFAELLRPFDLNPRQFAILSCLATIDGPSQQQLADILGVHRNAMVGLIDDLEVRHLVERHRQPNDRRAHSVRLTQLGQDTLLRAQDAGVTLEEEVMGELPQHERSQLIAMLQRVSTNVGLLAGLHPSLRE